MQSNRQFLWLILPLAIASFYLVATYRKSECTCICQAAPCSCPRALQQAVDKPQQPLNSQRSVIQQCPACPSCPRCPACPAFSQASNPQAVNLESEWRQSEYRAADPDYQQKCVQMIFEKPGQSFISQEFQDWFLFHNYFKKLGPKYRGVFVDVGANDAFLISNTLFFEKCLGWSGLCVEPLTHYHADYKRRSCKLIPHCVWNQEKTMYMYVNGALSSLKNVSFPGAFEVKCKTLEHILQENNIHKIDLLSLDVEGSEPTILGSFPFDKFDIHTWVIETFHLDPRHVDRLMHRGGFNKVANLAIDDVYEKATTKLQYPAEYDSRISDNEVFRASQGRVGPC